MVVKILASGFRHEEQHKEETESVDTSKEGETVGTHSSIHGRPASVDDKVGSPVAGVTKSRTSWQGIKWKQLGSNEPWNDTTTGTVGEGEKNSTSNNKAGQVAKGRSNDNEDGSDSLTEQRDQHPALTTNLVHGCQGNKGGNTVTGSVGKRNLGSKVIVTVEGISEKADRVD